MDDVFGHKTHNSTIGKNGYLVWTMMVLCGLFIGCTSDDTTSCVADLQGELTEEENKLVGRWVLSAIISEKEVDLTDDGEDNPQKDIYAQYSDCKNDRVYNFGTNRRYTFVREENPALACNDKTESSGTWKLNGDRLGLVTGCSTIDMRIGFDEETSQFSLTNITDIRDVQGNIITAEVTFAYTKFNE